MSVCIIINNEEALSKRILAGLLVFGLVAVIGLLLANQDTRAHTESQREESGESQFLGSLWRATLSREAWMPIWGLSTESMKPWPPPGGGRGYGTKRRRWCGGTGVPGGHDTHRPFTNRKAAPGEGTVIRARVGRPVPSGARSAQDALANARSREERERLVAAMVGRERQRNGGDDQHVDLSRRVTERRLRLLESEMRRAVQV